MYKITAAQLVRILDILNEEGDEVTLRTDYSGRSMYDATCIGFVGDGALEYALGRTMHEVLGDDVYDIGYPASDNMGRSQIVYFPKVELAEGEENDPRLEGR